MPISITPKLKALLCDRSMLVMSCGVAVSVLRESQNHVRAAEGGISLHEMRPSEVCRDLDTWRPLIHWVESRTATALTPRDLWPLSAESIASRLRAGEAQPDGCDERWSA